MARWIHANPRINQRIKDQVDQLEHVILAGFSHQPVIELSERLVKITLEVPMSRPTIILPLCTLAMVITVSSTHCTALAVATVAGVTGSRHATARPLG